MKSLDQPMKHLLLIAALLLTGCTDRNDFGECIGLDDREDPALEYTWHTGNVIAGLVFAETLIVPAVVLLTNVKCPVAKRENDPGFAPQTHGANDRREEAK